MKFTEHQERMVGFYLRQSGSIVKNLSPPAQTQSLLQVRLRLTEELLLLRRETVEDADMSALLDRLQLSPTGWLKPTQRLEIGPAALRPTVGPADRASPDVRPRREGQGNSSTVESLALEERRWLGVCLALSHRLAFPLSYVRAGFAITFLLTGPFALIIYLGLYFEMHFADQEPDTPRLDPRWLMNSMGRAVAALSILYIGTTMFFLLLNAVYEGLVSLPTGLGTWGRFADYHTPLFLAVLLALVPVAVLSGLPVPAPKRVAIRKFLYTGLSIYAVVLCLGIASYLTGILLAIAEGYNG